MYEPATNATRTVREVIAPARRTRLWRWVLAVCLLAGTFGTAGCFEGKIVTSKVEDLPANQQPSKMNGVFYALPRTVVKVDVPVNRVAKTPGEFVEFKPCFLPNDSFVAQKESTEFGVDGDNIKFDTTFIPDTQQVYMIKTNGGKFETKSLELALTESGVFVKATAESNNQAIDILTSTIKSGVGLLAKASGLGLLSSDADREKRIEASQMQAQADCVRQLKKDAEENKSDTEIYKRDINTAAMLERTLVNSAPAPSSPPSSSATTPSATTTPSPASSPAPAPTPVRAKDLVADPCGSGAKPEQCLEKFKRALALYEQIVTLQVRRTAILNTVTPNATVPADTLKLTLDELDKTIKELKQSGFLGTKDTLTWNASFRLNPMSDTEPKPKYHDRRSVDLFSISKTDGICKILAPNQGVLLDQLDKRFTKKCKETKTTGNPVSLEVRIGEDGEGGEGGKLMSDRVKAAQLKQTGERGFYYRVPGRAIAFVYQQGDVAGSKDELGRAPLSIAQFGEVVSLPASAGGRRTKYSLDLYESSGGLRNFVMGSSALIEKSNIEDLTGAAATAIEAKGERKKAKAPADELDQLERQRKILEERKKIRDLQQDLDETGNSNSSNP